MVAVDIQFAASHVGWPVLRAASIAAVDAGYDAIWVLDHLSGSTFGGDRGLECFTWLGALAASVPGIDFGVLVANVWNRQLGTLAVAATSVAEISGRPFMLGIGAGSSPQSRWADEQLAVGADIEESMSARHQRVERFIDLTDEMWGPEPSERFAAFTRPSPRPTRIVGVNSTELSDLAGRRADGVNVAWHHPRRDELISAAVTAAAGREFAVTVWARWSADLLDPSHPDRVALEERSVDRLVLALSDEIEGFLASPRPSLRK